MRYKLDDDFYQVLSMQNLHICARRADYSLLFGERDHLACYARMIEANQIGGDGHDQLLTYMATV